MTGLPSSQTSTLLGLLQTMRPHQWVKNGFVLTPLIFAKKLEDLPEWMDPESVVTRTLGAFLLFCIGSGLVYLLNDLVDREKDQLHPQKKDRPIPSGELPVPIAQASLGVGLILTGSLALALSVEFAALLGAYIGMNVAYSFRLKNVIVADILCIATGFLLRVGGGAIAANVPVTEWLYTITFALALFLALGKRKQELQQMGEHGATTRSVLASYSQRGVRLGMGLTGVLAVGTYCLYCFSDHAFDQFETRSLGWTIPFLFFGFARFIQLTRGADQSPTDAMIRDPLFLANLGAWTLVVGGVIYG